MRRLILALSLFLIATTSTAQLWIASFGETNGSATGVAGGTTGGTWSVTTTPSGGNNSFTINNGTFRVNNTGNEGVWSSNTINISAVGYAILSSSFYSIGIGFSSSDYLRFYYSLDGGPETLFADIPGSLISASTNVSAIVAGSTIRVIIRGVDNSLFGVVGFDDISVTAAPVIYSRKSGDWNDLSLNGTWSLVSHTGPGCSCIPINSQVAIIGNSNTVRLTSSQAGVGLPPLVNLAPGAIDIQNTGILEYHTNGAVLGVQKGLVRVRNGGTIRSSSAAITGSQLSFDANVGGATLQIDAGGTVIIEDIVLGPAAGSLHYLTGLGNLVVTDDVLINATGGTLTNDMTGTFLITDRVEFQSGITDGTFINNYPLSFSTVFFDNDNGTFVNNSALTITNLQSGTGDDNNAFINSVGATTTLVTITPNNGNMNISNAGTINQTGNFTVLDNGSSFVNEATGIWNWSLTPTTGFDSDMSTVLTAATGSIFDYLGAGDQTIIPATYYNLNLSTSGTKTATATLDVNGNLALANSTTLTAAANSIDVEGDISIQNTAVLGGTGAILIGGNWSSINAASFLEGTRTVTFDGAGVQTITNSSGTETFYNVAFATSGSKSTSNLLDIDNNLTISGSAVLDVANNITLAGNWTVTGTNADRFVEGTNTVTLDGTGTQAISTVYGSGETFYNLSITGAGIKSNTSAINIANDLSIAGTNTTQLSGAGNISLGGKWDITSSHADPFVEGTRTVTFNGTSSQSINTVLAVGEQFYNLVIANTSGMMPQVTANDKITVSNTLTMNDGNLETSAANLLTMLNGTTSNTGSASSYVDGPMQFNMAVNGTRTLNFPIGKSGNFGGVVLRVSHNAATAYAYTAEVIASSAAALNYTLATGTDKVSSVRYWDINRGTTATPLTTNNTNLVTTGTTTAPRITLNYVGADGVTQPTNVTIVKNVGGGSVWNNLTGVATGSPAGSVISANASTSFTSFSYFTLANKTGGTNPLPIELIYFKATPTNDRVMLTWETANEMDNDYFTIERAVDIEKFGPIADAIDGAGTTNERHTYNVTDENPLYGRSYYRLKQTDYDGKTTYSQVVTVEYDGPTFATLQVYPNPSTGQSVMVSVRGLRNQPNLPLQIISSSGQIVYENTFDVDTPGTFQKEVVFSHPLNPGIYLIRAGNTSYLTKKLSIE